MVTSGTKEWARYNVNFSKGCSNNCKYCYAKKMGKRFGWKENWVDMENKESMSSKSFNRRDGLIMCPSSHDITDANIDLALKVFKNILRPGNDLLIVSKPKFSLIERICTELEEWKEQVIFRFTVGTLDDSIRKKWEPGAPSIYERFSSLKLAYDLGWQTSISIEPMLDENVTELIDELLPWVTESIWVGPMNKIHVPKELWTKSEEQLYSRESLIGIKKKIELLNSDKIRFKDHFLSKIS